MYEITSTCKGGGYTYCRTNPKHPKSNSKGLYPLHRVLAENKIGRELLSNEHVHHKDENKFNNEINNLEVLSNSEHSKLHRIKKDFLTIICPSCKKEFLIKPHEYKRRSSRNKSSKVFCSLVCSGKMMKQIQNMEFSNPSQPNSI